MATKKGKATTAKKKALKKSDREMVADYMADLDHPLKAEIEAVRTIIMNASKKISERIKWNAPSYYYKVDMVTFNPRETGRVHLVFHHPAIEGIQSSLLEGDYVSRRMTYFHTMKEVKAGKEELERIINELIDRIDNQ